MPCPSAAFQEVSRNVRAGGATHDFLTHKSVSRLRLKGRWSVEKSLDHYVQEATSLLCLVRIPLGTQKHIVQLLSLFAKGPSPPSVPWKAFFSREQQERLTRLALSRHGRLYDE